MNSDLEDRIRTSLAVHAHDVEPGPAPGLAEQAVDRAGRIRWTRRIQVAAGVAVVAVAVATVPFLTGSQRAQEQVPGHSSAPTLPGVLYAQRVALDADALMASGLSILDGASDRTVTLPEPSSLAGDHPMRISQVYRANPGYFVVWGPDTSGDGAPKQTASWVSTDGKTVITLGHPDFGARMAVSRDGLLAAVSTPDGGRHRMVLFMPDSYDSFGSFIVDQPANALAFVGHGLWFEAAVDPRGPPEFWSFSDNTITPLAVSSSVAWRAQSGTTMIVFDSGDAQATIAYGVSRPDKPRELWRSSGSHGLVVFGGVGETVLMTGGIDGEGPTVVTVDARTGQTTASGAIPDRASIYAAAYANAWVLLGVSPEGGTQTVQLSDAQGDVLGATTRDYPDVPANSLVLGQETSAPG